jgi:hypothetical protein
MQAVLLDQTSADSKLVKLAIASSRQ